MLNNLTQIFIYIYNNNNNKKQIFKKSSCKIGGLIILKRITWNKLREAGINSLVMGGLYIYIYKKYCEYVDVEEAS